MTETTLRPLPGAEKSERKNGLKSWREWRVRGDKLGIESKYGGFCQSPNKQIWQLVID